MYTNQHRFLRIIHAGFDAKFIAGFDVAKVNRKIELARKKIKKVVY